MCKTIGGGSMAMVDIMRERMREISRDRRWSFRGKRQVCIYLDHSFAVNFKVDASATLKFDL
jgi:hypothetical protein